MEPLTSIGITAVKAVEMYRTQLLPGEPMIQEGIPREQLATGSSRNIFVRCQGNFIWMIGVVEVRHGYFEASSITLAKKCTNGRTMHILGMVRGLQITRHKLVCEVCLNGNPPDGKIKKTIVARKKQPVRKVAAKPKPVAKKRLSGPVPKPLYSEVVATIAFQVRKLSTLDQINVARTVVRFIGAQSEDYLKELLEQAKSSRYQFILDDYQEMRWSKFYKLVVVPAEELYGRLCFAVIEELG